VLAGEWVCGTFLNLGSAMTVEIAGLARFDWLLIDHEHGPGGEDTLLHQLHAASATPAFPIVRIAMNETPRFKRVLDMGALGVMVPYVSSAAEAKAAVQAMRYPPHGIRGVAKINRAAGSAGISGYTCRRTSGCDRDSDRDAEALETSTPSRPSTA